MANSLITPAHIGPFGSVCHPTLHHLWNNILNISETGDAVGLNLTICIVFVASETVLHSKAIVSSVSESYAMVLSNILLKVTLEVVNSIVEVERVASANREMKLSGDVVLELVPVVDKDPCEIELR